MAMKNQLSPSAFRILDLPPEIVGNICNALPDEDLHQTRFVCRELKALASTAFGTRFFNHVVATLHPASLGILLEIARHKEISRFVRKVTISGEQAVNLEGSEMVPKMLLNMEKSGLDSLLLVEVFRCLPRLDVVRMDVISVHRVQCIILPVYCGATVGIFKTNDDQKYSTVYGYNRVYKTVLSALEASGVHKDAKLELDLKDAIPAAVSMILNDYRGTDKLGTSNSAREFLVSVDLRKAKAEVEQRIIWDGEGWKLSVEHAIETTALIKRSPISVPRNEDSDEDYDGGSDEDSDNDSDENSDDAETLQENSFAENNIRHNVYTRGYIERGVYGHDYDSNQGDCVDYIDYPYTEDFPEGFFSDEE